MTPRGVGSSALPIRTERLLLRELADSDFDAVHAYATDLEVVRYMPWGPNSEAETQAFLDRAQAEARVRPRIGYELAITVATTGELAGAIGLHRETARDTDAMLGYCLARPAWGRGFATEAGAAVVRFGFTSLELETIWAGCDVRNAGSVRVLEKLGMTLESRHKHAPEDVGDASESFMFRLKRDLWWEGRGAGSAAS